MPTLRTEDTHADNIPENNTSAWPLVVSVLDMVGPLSAFLEGHKYLLVAIDKVTKWIVAKLVINVEADTAVMFIFGIIHRFGVRHCSIISDNGSNFIAYMFKEFCHRRRIHIDYASVTHPQSNELVKWANGLIMRGLKPQLITPLVRAKGK